MMLYLKRLVMIRVVTKDNLLVNTIYILERAIYR